MALLSQLLGNRELAWEDQLEKGRIWVYGDGNEYTGLCNGFCWKPPGCGLAVIEIWGAGGSMGRGCCCGMSVPPNPGAYAKKCICVCPSNYVCGFIGRACGDTPAYCRGYSEAVCICWFGCSPTPIYNGGMNPTMSSASWKGNNPWGWGNGENWGNICQNDSKASNWAPRSSDCTHNICCPAGSTRGCMCAQGGKSGVFWCIDGGMSVMQCFARTRFCQKTIGGKEICGWWICARVCNYCSDFYQPYNTGGPVCAFGGDINCCGTISCTSNFDCAANNNNCRLLYHYNTPAMQYSTEGGVYTFPMDTDSPSGRVSGNGLMAQIAGVQTLSRHPSHNAVAHCWDGSVACGCYEAFGCIPMAPMGQGGYPTNVCGDVRDHGGRGVMGAVRIRYIPTDGGNTY